jgi:hypothetical protein
MDVVAGLGRVRARIVDAGGDLDRVEIVAVTKGHGPEAVRAAAAVGLADVGENYAQELVAKAEAVDDPRLRWHFIGRLQRNKVRQVSHLVRCWQSVDRLAVGEEIARRSPGAAVLVEVGLTDDPVRAGARPGLVPGLVDALRDLGLDVQGLMAVGPQGPLADQLGLRTRSIGMSDDLELAVAEGSTMVRVGSALFGPRPPR